MRQNIPVIALGFVHSRVVHSTAMQKRLTLSIIGAIPFTELWRRICRFRTQFTLCFLNPDPNRLSTEISGTSCAKRIIRSHLKLPGRTLPFHSTNIPGSGLQRPAP
ncbi:hypothetical protein [Leisingera sp. M658]|uniref:hypothetical protein n=1 Tax=Leisingera sp. M658 TaxID=2867015 RepID=UPI0021A8B4C6|nr:hypothetical protein [Leisingera sp. M658]UWQ74488.1 hypothetical protein K3724_18750 [Leisingera sp. M658]